MPSPRTRLLLILVLLWAAGASPARAETEPPERIILIVIDTLRQDHLSCYGGRVSTPNIDKLAARGQRFTRAVSSFHMTSMSMGSLFSGRTPSLEVAGSDITPFNGRTWCGLARFADDAASKACIPDRVPTLAQRLRDAGFWTIGVGSNPFFFGESGFSRGFDDWNEVKHRRLRNKKTKAERNMAIADGRSGISVNEAAIRAIGERPNDRFFLYVHYMDAHDYAWREIPYDRGVGLVDSFVGRLLAVLGNRGLLEKSVVILTSDHGERLDELHPLQSRPSHMGNPSFDYLVRVPLIVSPAVADDPNQPLRSDDVHRMILRLAQQDALPPADLKPGELFLTELLWRTYRNGRWKSMWPKSGAKPALFDLESDPAETANVAHLHADVLETHRARIEALRTALAARVDAAPELSDQDRARLEALGYLELANPEAEAHTH